MRLSPFLAATAIVAFHLAAVPAWAEVTVRNAWVRATFAPGRPTAGYAEIENSGPGDDELVGVSTPVASMADIHRTVNEGGIMKMEPVSAMPVPAGASVKLAPGGYHIMIMDVAKTLKAGDTVEMTFTFKTQGPVEVTAKVAPLAAEQAP